MWGGTEGRGAYALDGGDEGHVEDEEEGWVDFVSNFLPAIVFDSDFVATFAPVVEGQAELY